MLGSQSQPIIVELLDLPVEKKSEQQIVSPSDSPERVKPNDTRFLAAKDSSTFKETLRRGLPDAGTLASRVREKIPEANSSSQKPGGALSKIPGNLGQLRLGDEIIAKKLQPRAKSPGEQVKDNDLAREQALNQYQPFRQASPAVIAGHRGSPDFLPSIEDGELTLLNAKADRFAVFVRRVALQVFGALRRRSWANLMYTDLSKIKEPVSIRAILSPQGKLLNVLVEGSSGGRIFDQVVEAAIREGAWDQNPPAAALATDGNIHFVFRAQTWSRMAAGGAQEQRWILLATGLL